MKSLEHFRATAEQEGIFEGVLTMLPDIFIAGRIIPNESWRRLCMNLHNTKEGVQDVTHFNKRLGGAWQRHREQDLATHPFGYEYIPDPLPELPKDSVMLYSGGLDSFVTWRLLGQPKAVYFAIGHRAEARELAMVEKVNEKFGGNIEVSHRLNLADVEMPNGYIPYRNLFFIMMASYYSPNVVISQILEHAPDKNSRFYEKTSDLLEDITKGSFQQLEGGEIKVLAPFNRYTKTELVRQYKARGLPMEDITNFSTSCYSNKEVNCGECSSCFSRYVAMENNGVHEEYAVVPDAQKFAKKWSIRDFDIHNFRMYIKRYLEMKPYLKND
jgi:hypothetical protein